MKDNLEKLEEKLKEFKFMPRTIKEVLEMKFSKNPFIVAGLIPEKGITIISGQPGCGKSWVALHIMKSIASQKDAFGKFKTKKENILLIDGETGFAEVQRRMKLMGFRKDKNIYVHSEDDLKLDQEKDLKKIVEFVKNEKIGFVILDPFIALHNSDENVAKEIQKVMNAIKKIIRAGATVLVIHHHRKNEDSNNPSLHIRGSSAIHGAVDSHIEVKGEDGELEVLQIGQYKARRGKPEKPFIVKVENDEKGLMFKFVDYIQEPLNGIQKIRDVLLTILNPEEGKELKFIWTEVNKIAPMGVNKIRAELKDLIKLDKAKMQRIGHNTYLYFKC